MAIKPILFNTEMVRAILDGRKTQTRRIIKPQPNGQIKPEPGFITWSEHKEIGEKRWRPPYQKGDVVWVRETWKTATTGNSGPGMIDKFIYKADEPQDNDGMIVESRWHPSIHMLWIAARIFLLVKSVRAERLQDITDADALKEGVPQDDDFPMNSVFCPVCHGEGHHGAHHPVSLGYMEVDCENCDTPVKRFSHLWNSTIKYDDVPRLGWGANPFVWVIEFERTEQETPF